MDQTQSSAAAAILSGGWLGKVDWLQTIDSTSSEVRRRLEAETGSDLPGDRFLVVADQQTAGRGRGGNHWWSPSGCLMLSLALSSSDCPEQAARIPLLAHHIGLAVADTIESWQEDTSEPLRLSLKWPNDVYLGDKKAAGILIESANAPGGLRWIVGIGLNVNMDWTMAPQEVAERATCMSRQAGMAIAPPVVLVHLIESIERQVNRWKDANDSSWHARWQSRCLLQGRSVMLNSSGKEISGLCNGVDQSGRLLVQDTKTLHRIQSAEIVSWSSI
jgi:BirA family biotin operon repressor/biotin-[acetyl-CoA-carboxylase] ligase